MSSRYPVRRYGHHDFNQANGPSQDEKRVVRQARTERTVMDATTAEGAYGADLIAGLHNHVNDKFTEVAKHVLRDRSDLEPRPRAAVETFSESQLPMAAEHLSAVTYVASEQVINTVGRSKYPEPEPKGILGRLRGD